MRNIIISSLLFGSIGGCANGGLNTSTECINEDYVTRCAHQVYGTSYQVEIDSSFPTEDTTALLVGLSSWEKISNGLITFQTSIFNGTCDGRSNWHTICVHASSQDAIVAMGGESSFLGNTMRMADLDGSDIYIPVSKDSGLTSDQMITIFAHETAHAMGLVHTSNDTVTLMYPEINGSAALPTCNDYQQFIDLRSDALAFLSNPNCPNGGHYTLYGK